ncbi:MAG: hypothetical protein MUF01_08260 [Bryobacterales bacterium]|nr:hypothetical protein [Bryobacterales bacterium]
MNLIESKEDAMRGLAVVVCLWIAMSAMAWEETLTQLGITRQQVESNVQSALASGGGMMTPRVPKEAVAAYKGMGDPDKVKVVKDGIAAARTIVMSEAFRKADDEQIRRQYGGIDHGLRVMSADELNRQLSARKITSAAYEQATLRMRAGAAAERAYRDYTDSLRSSLEGDLRSAEYIAKQMPDEKPDPKQRMALLKAALALARGNEADFRRAAAVALSFGAGGPADPADAELAAKEEQQRIYNQFSINGKLREGLTKFIEVAGQVNFAAATAPKGNRVVFVDPAMERATPAHKFLYRLGKAPTLAAVAEAKAWLAELR